MNRVRLSARQEQLIAALDKDKWRAPPVGTGLKTAIQLAELGHIEIQGPVTARQYRLTSCGHIIQLNIAAFAASSVIRKNRTRAEQTRTEQGSSPRVGGANRSASMDIHSPTVAAQDPEYQHACEKVLDLPIQDLIDRAVQAGWRTAEVIAAVQVVANKKLIAYGEDPDPQDEEVQGDGDSTTPEFSGFPVD